MIDIGAAAVPLPERAFDAVAIVDVPFHIVDDERYAQALANLSGLLKPGGAMTLSENLVPRQQPSRSSGHSEQRLDPIRPRGGWPGHDPRVSGCSS